MPLTFDYIYFCFVLWSLIAELFSNLLLRLCQPLPFGWVGETPPVWVFLDAMTCISLLTPPLFWLFLSLIEIPLSKDSLCPISPNCCRQPEYENNQITKCLNPFHRFLSCFQSQFESSCSAFTIGGLQKHLCAQQPDCSDNTSLQTLPYLSLDYYSYDTTLKCTVKALFYQIHPIL